MADPDCNLPEPCGIQGPHPSHTMLVDDPTPPMIANAPEKTIQLPPDGINIAQQFRRIEPNAQEGVDALKKNIGPDDLLLAVRCPCGFMMGLGIPRETFTRSDASALAIRAMKKFIPMLVDHIDPEIAEHVCPLRQLAQQDQPKKE